QLLKRGRSRLGHHRALAMIPGRKCCCVTPLRITVRRLYLDDLCAQLGQHPACERTQLAGEIEYPQMSEHVASPSLPFAGLTQRASVGQRRDLFATHAQHPDQYLLLMLAKARRWLDP